LGEWREQDARKIPGQPQRRRDAYEDGVVTGNIFCVPRSQQALS
jgi:hypothetical protein